MTTLISEINLTKRKQLIKTFESSGLRMVQNSPSYLEFEYGLRTFIIYSDNFNDKDIGINTYVDLDKFFKQNFLHKLKHSQRIKDRLDKKQNLEDALKVLNWKILDSINLSNFSFQMENDDYPEAIYEISIRGRNHLVYNNEVYEMDLEPIKSLIKIDALTALNRIDQNLINNLKAFFIK